MESITAVPVITILLVSHVIEVDDVRCSRFRNQLRPR